jgi:hypothetical protein
LGLTAAYLWSFAATILIQRTGSITSQALLGGLHHHYMRV